MGGKTLGWTPLPVELLEPADERQRTLDLVTRQVRLVAPASCCPHGDAPCLGCGLEWVVAHGIEISVRAAASPVEEGERLVEVLRV